MAATLITGVTNAGCRQRGARSFFRTAVGVCYWVAPGLAVSKAMAWKSATPEVAASWARQDSAGEGSAVFGNFSYSAAIDSNGLIGCIYATAANNVVYNTFDITTDSWGAEETIAVVTSVNDRGIAIAFDANNKPHVCWSDGTSFDLFYANKVGVAWSAPITLHTYGRWPDIIIDNSNVPVVAYTPYAIPNNGNIMACLGDANDPTTFTQTVLSNAGTNPRYRMPSMALCANGDIVIARANNANDADPRPLTLLRHLAASDWATWEAEETIDASNENQEPSIAVNGNVIYIFCEKTSADAGIWYWENSAGPTTWASHQVVTAASLYAPKVRWGIRNNPSYNKYLMDYTWFNDTDDEQYWDALDLTVANPKALFFPRQF